MRRLVIVAVATATLIGSLGLAAPARGAEPWRVAIIVGPVGEELTPTYLDLAELAAAAAEQRGASVARAYSPDATAENVLAAVEGADIVVYFGHGFGTPNPYGADPNPAVVNGWGLNGPGSRGTHADTAAHGALVYYGEAWIAAHARPAPGWVMIYSNACYAPGAGEGGLEPPATEAIAAERVAAYSRVPLAKLGASAYFATDFYAGAAELVGGLLDDPSAAYAAIFSAEPRFDPERVATLPYPDRDGAELWLQHSPYFDGEANYWYAFAGDPEATLAGGTATAAPAQPSVVERVAPPEIANGLVTGMASSYTETGRWAGRATVALPAVIGGEVPDTLPSWVLVCADRCVSLPVVDSCPCYVGTADQRVANLSLEAWRQVTDDPLEEGLVRVWITFPDADPTPTGWRGGAPTS